MKAKKQMPGNLAAHYKKVGADIENQRIVEILENHRISIVDISSNNWIGLWHDAIAKVKAGAEISQGRINEDDFHSRLKALAKRSMCFDNLKGTGCEHSVCFMLNELIESIEK